MIHTVHHSGKGPDQVQRSCPVCTSHTPRRRTQANLDMMSSTEVIASKLIEVARLRDPDLAAHSERTAEVACAIGVQMGLSLDSIDDLYLAAQLHDVGKLGISESVLWKPGRLTRSEWNVIKTHPEEGHRLVADVVSENVASAVLYHHERVDGEGYPFGLSERRIPLPARIVQVADAFDAMTSDRPYQAQMPIRYAVEEITRCAGTQFDPDVAQALGELYNGRRDARPPEERRIERNGQSAEGSTNLIPTPRTVRR